MLPERYKSLIDKGTRFTHILPHIWYCVGTIWYEPTGLRHHGSCGWRQIGTRPSATALLVWRLPLSQANHVTQSGLQVISQSLTVVIIHCVISGSWRSVDFFHWYPIIMSITVIMSTLSPLAAPGVVITTTSDATNNYKVGIMAALRVQ